MEIIRDSAWTAFYSDEMSHNKTSESKILYANACWRAHICLKSIKDKKKEKSLKILSELPKQVIQVKMNIKNCKCQSQTLAGKACQFKAISGCGRFCKKHSI